MRFCAAENGFNLSRLYLVARYHTSPEGHVHETLSRRFPQLLMKMTKCGRWRNAVSILFIYLFKKKGKGNLKFIKVLISVNHLEHIEAELLLERFCNSLSLRVDSETTTGCRRIIFCQSSM